jgi:radical SAM protein with 4Fe4S-binding SPASM domain
MNKKFIDPAIERKRKAIDISLKKVRNFPLPSVIEISESGTCNRSCDFCPRSDINYPDEKKFIDKNLLNKLLIDLESFDYEGIFLFSGFVEPMLDKKIFDHISAVRFYLPKAKIELVTNGDILTKEKVSKLFKSGLSTLLISVYDSADDVKRFQNMIDEAKIDTNKVVIRHRYLGSENSFGITLSNRAGAMDNAKFKIASLSKPSNKTCYYPHYTFFMDYKGDVLICSHDWLKKKIVGNLNQSSFEQIWTSSEFNEARKSLQIGNRNFEPCKKCDVIGNLMGQQHVESWKDYFLN